MRSALSVLVVLCLAGPACGRPPAAPIGGLPAPAASVPTTTPTTTPAPRPPADAVLSGDGQAVAVLAPDAPRQTVQLSALVACTRMMCPPDRPCCNRCSALHWAKGGLRAAAAAGAPALPTPTPDGCGAVNDVLDAVGVEHDGTLWVESWTLRPLPASAPAAAP